MWEFQGIFHGRLVIGTDFEGAAEWETPAKYYHFNTRLLHKDQYLNVNQDYDRLLLKREDVAPPFIYKKYIDAEEIPLPLPNFNLREDFLNTLLNRQTTRSFSIAL